MIRPVAAVLVTTLALSAPAVAFSQEGTSSRTPPRSDAPLSTDTLRALYVATFTTQALDAHSTTRALSRGALERNPLMRMAARDRGTFLAVKAAATSAIIFAAHRAGRHHRRAAVVLLVVVNAISVAVSAHNYTVAARSR